MMRNIIIIGMAATGKSTIGKLLAEQVHKDFIDLDRKIETHCGVDIETIFAIEGESGFRLRETEELKRTLQEEQNYVLSFGGGTVIKEENRALIDNTDSVVIQLYPSDLNVVVERIVHSPNKRPLLSAVNNIAVKVKKLYEERKAYYDLLTDIKIDISSGKPIQTVNNILKELKSFNK